MKRYPTIKMVINSIRSQKYAILIADQPVSTDNRQIARLAQRTIPNQRINVYLAIRFQIQHDAEKMLDNQDFSATEMLVLKRKLN